MRAGSFVTSFAAIVCLAGCGDDGGGGALAPADYPAALADALCGKLDDCCDWSQLGEPGIESYDDCVSAVEPYFEGNVADLEASLSRGRIEWNASLAANCLDDFEATACGAPLSDALDACDAVVVAQVANGGQCSIDFECVSDVCAFDDVADEEGTCATSAAGDPCVLSCYGVGTDRSCFSTCTDGLVCSTRLEGEQTVSTCEVEVLAGEGESCAENACDDSVFCNEALVCETPRADGRACASDFECQSDNCVDGVCAASTSCDVSF